MTIDFNSIASVLIAAALLGVGRYLWHTAIIVAKLEVKVEDHEKRLDKVEAA
jgi:hypothetical protein